MKNRGRKRGGTSRSVWSFVNHSNSKRRKRLRRKNKRNVLLQQLEKRVLLTADTGTTPSNSETMSPLFGSYLESLSQQTSQHHSDVISLTSLPQFSLQSAVPAPDTGFDASFQYSVTDLDMLALDTSDAVDAVYSGTSTLNLENGTQTFTYSVLIDGNAQNAAGDYHELVTIGFVDVQDIDPNDSDVGTVTKTGTFTYEFWATANGDGFDFDLDIDVSDTTGKIVDETWNEIEAGGGVWTNVGHFNGAGVGSDSLSIDFDGSTASGSQPVNFSASGGGNYSFTGGGAYHRTQSFSDGVSVADAQSKAANDGLHDLWEQQGTTFAHNTDTWTYTGTGTVVDKATGSWLPILNGFNRAGDSVQRVEHDGTDVDSSVDESKGQVAVSDGGGFRSWYLDTSEGGQNYRVSRLRDVVVDAGTKFENSYSVTSGFDHKHGRTTTVDATGDSKDWYNEIGTSKHNIDQAFAGVGETLDYDYQATIDEDSETTQTVHLTGTWRTDVLAKAANDEPDDKSGDDGTQTETEFIPGFIGSLEVTTGLSKYGSYANGKYTLDSSDYASHNDLTDPTLPGGDSTSSDGNSDSGSGGKDSGTGGSSTDTKTASAGNGHYTFVEKSHGFVYDYDSTTIILNRKTVWSADRENEFSDGSTSHSDITDKDKVDQPLVQTYEYQSTVTNGSKDHLKSKTNVMRKYKHDSNDDSKSSWGTLSAAAFAAYTPSKTAKPIDVPAEASIESFSSRIGDSKSTLKVDGSHELETKSIRYIDGNPITKRAPSFSKRIFNDDGSIDRDSVTNSDWDVQSVSTKSSESSTSKDSSTTTTQNVDKYSTYGAVDRNSHSKFTSHSIGTKDFEHTDLLGRVGELRIELANKDTDGVTYDYVSDDFTYDSKTTDNDYSDLDYTYQSYLTDEEEVDSTAGTASDSNSDAGSDGGASSDDGMGDDGMGDDGMGDDGMGDDGMGDDGMGDDGMGDDGMGDDGMGDDGMGDDGMGDDGMGDDGMGDDGMGDDGMGDDGMGDDGMGDDGMGDDGMGDDGMGDDGMGDDGMGDDGMGDSNDGSTSSESGGTEGNSGEATSTETEEPSGPQWTTIYEGHEHFWGDFDHKDKFTNGLLTIESFNRGVGRVNTETSRDGTYTGKLTKVSNYDDKTTYSGESSGSDSSDTETSSHAQQKSTADGKIVSTRTYTHDSNYKTKLEDSVLEGYSNEGELQISLSEQDVSGVEVSNTTITWDDLTKDSWDQKSPSDWTRDLGTHEYTTDSKVVDTRAGTLNEKTTKASHIENGLTSINPITEDNGQDIAARYIVHTNNREIDGTVTTTSTSKNTHKIVDSQVIFERDKGKSETKISDTLTNGDDKTKGWYSIPHTDDSFVTFEEQFLYQGTAKSKSTTTTDELRTAPEADVDAIMEQGLDIQTWRMDVEPVGDEPMPADSPSDKVDNQSGGFGWNQLKLTASKTIHDSETSVERELSSSTPLKRTEVMATGGTPVAISGTSIELQGTGIQNDINVTRSELVDKDKTGFHSELILADGVWNEKVVRSGKSSTEETTSGTQLTLDKVYALYGPIWSSSSKLRTLFINTDDKSETKFEFTTVRTGDSLINLSAPVTTGTSDTEGKNTVDYTGLETTLDKSHSHGEHWVTHNAEVENKLTILPSTNVTDSEHHVIMTTEAGKLITRTHGNSKNVVTEDAVGIATNDTANNWGEHAAGGDTETSVLRDSVHTHTRKYDYADHRDSGGFKHRTGFSEVANDATVTTIVETDDHFTHSAGQVAEGSMTDKVVVTSHNSARDDWDHLGNRTLVQKDESKTSHAVDMSPDSENPTKGGFTPGGGTNFYDNPDDAALEQIYYNYTFEDARYKTTAESADSLTTYFPVSGATKSKRDVSNNFVFDILGWSVSVDGLNNGDESEFEMEFESMGGALRHNHYTRAYDGTAVHKNKTDLGYSFGPKSDADGSKDYFYIETTKPDAKVDFKLEMSMDQTIAVNRDITLVNGKDLYGSYSEMHDANGWTYFKSQGKWEGSAGDYANYEIESGDNFNFSESVAYPDLTIPEHEAEIEHSFFAATGTGIERKFDYYDADGNKTSGITGYDDDMLDHMYFMNGPNHSGGSFETTGSIWDDNMPSKSILGAAMIFMPHGEDRTPPAQYADRLLPGPTPDSFGGGNIYGDLGQRSASRAIQRSYNAGTTGLRQTIDMVHATRQMHLAPGDQTLAFEEMGLENENHSNWKNILAHGESLSRYFDAVLTFEADASALQYVMLTALPGADLAMSMVNVASLAAHHSAQTPSASPGRAIIVSPNAQASLPTVELAQSEAAITSERQVESQAHTPIASSNTTTFHKPPNAVADFAKTLTQRDWDANTKNAEAGIEQTSGSPSENDAPNEEPVDSESEGSEVAAVDITELTNQALSNLSHISETDMGYFLRDLPGKYHVYRTPSLIIITAGDKRFVFYLVSDNSSGVGDIYGFDNSASRNKRHWTLIRVVADTVSIPAIMNHKRIEAKKVFYDRLESGTEFALHMLPGGTFADWARGGIDEDWKYVAVVTAGDLTMVGGLYFKGGKAGVRLAKAGMAVDAVGAGLAAHNISQDLENGAAHKGEFLLRLVSLGLGVRYRSLPKQFAGLPALNQTCFVAGTPVLTPQGARSIEDLKPGDKVYSRPEGEPTAPIREQTVEAVFELSNATLVLTIGGQEIETTGEHPFFVEGKGWTPAKQLETGDSLLGAQGPATTLDAIRSGTATKTVYNMRVSEDHTYFVGGDEWGFSVWVHNTYTKVKVGDNLYHLKDAKGEFVKIDGMPRAFTGEAADAFIAATPKGVAATKLVEAMQSLQTYAKELRDLFKSKGILQTSPHGDLVGIRGSLVRGKSYKDGRLVDFDPTDFDADMFIVVDDAAYSQLVKLKPEEDKYLALRHLGGDFAQYEQSMKNSVKTVSGHKDKFDVRIFSLEEWNRIRHKNHPFKLFNY